MARRSLLSPALEKPLRAAEPEANPPSEAQEPTKTRPSRVAKLHIGGYFDPNDPTLIAFQKLRIDLRRPQQELLMEAIRDFVAKHEANRAFR
jgi:hypothetical protein